MQVNFQRDSLETVRYIDLPAYARIRGNRLPVARWSFQGFYVDVEPGTSLLDGAARSRVSSNGDGELVEVEFVLPFPTHEAAVHVKCQPSAGADGRVYFQFLDLRDAVRRLMREYFDSCLAAIEPDGRADYSLVAPLTRPETAKINGSLLRRLFSYLVVFVAVGTLGWFLWREFTYVYSLRGSVMGDLVQYRSPDQGAIKKIFVKDGDHVEAGQLLYELDHSAYDHQLAQLERWKASAEEEVKAVNESIEEEGHRASLYTLAAERKLDMMSAQEHGLEAQVGTADAVRARDQKLFDQALVPQETLDVAVGASSQLRAQLSELQAQIDLQKIVIAESRNNRFLSTSDGMSFTSMGLSTANLASGATSGGSSLAIFDIKGNLPALHESLASKRTAEAQIDAQRIQVENSVQRCIVHATCAGVVNYVNRHEGDSVTNSDYVMSVTTDSAAGQKYVAARFTAEDARYISFGVPCEIVSLTRGEKYIGKVSAIDSGLGEHGSRAPDEETATDELVVKFELPRDATLRGGESVYVKLRREWTLAGFMQRFR